MYWSRQVELSDELSVDEESVSLYSDLSGSVVSMEASVDPEQVFVVCLVELFFSQ